MVVHVSYKRHGEILFTMSLVTWGVRTKNRANDDKGQSKKNYGISRFYRITMGMCVLANWKPEPTPRKSKSKPKLWHWPTTFSFQWVTGPGFYRLVSLSEGFPSFHSRGSAPHQQSDPSFRYFSHTYRHVASFWWQWQLYPGLCNGIALDTHPFYVLLLIGTGLDEY